jgi:hypothetical protein
MEPSNVVPLNLKRRHLDESQRGIVHARIATPRHGVRSDTAIAVSVPTEEAAKLLNVSLDIGQRARKVISDGTKELIAAVDDGKVSVFAAGDVAKLPKEGQWNHRRWSWFIETAISFRRRIFMNLMALGFLPLSGIVAATTLFLGASSPPNETSPGLWPEVFCGPRR